MGWDDVEKTIHNRLAKQQYRRAYKLLWNFCELHVAHYGNQMLGGHNHAAVVELILQIGTQMGRELAAYTGMMPLRVWFWRLVHPLGCARAPAPLSFPVGPFPGQEAFVQWLSQLLPPQRSLVLVPSCDPEPETLSVTDLAQILRLTTPEVDQQWQELIQQWRALNRRLGELREGNTGKESPHGK